MQVQLDQFQIGREGLDKLSTAVRSSTKFLGDCVVVQLFIPTFFLSLLAHAFFEKNARGNRFQLDRRRLSHLPGRKSRSSFVRDLCRSQLHMLL